ncbi:hypothetical protein E2R68_10815 [Psychromonas sp. RZ22]|uniref:Solitary outer membrane autotransporter beta-barrel domain n=1 Tax=Psychromonas algarum TaxID=2555643 RepID=UPI0010673CC1|nr:Solitary outer membrane autotransporter beta-barrel domain [Psychromonas sp. RZ22]TEW53967.1 hypothetical protein E2R68_10815 [Psychromonas sp. RZ22]
MKAIKLGLLLSSCYLGNAMAASVPQQNIAQIFATGVFLNNSDAISFGLANFDPKTILQQHPDPDVASKSVELRNQLTVTNLPYTIQYTDKNNTFYDEIKFNLSYIAQNQDQDFPGTSIEDTNKDTIWGFYTAYNRNWVLGRGWQLSSGLGQYLMHYKNEHNYNSVESASYKDVLDGQYYNLSSNAFVLEPSIGLKYQQDQGWGYWTFNSNYQYFYGLSFGGAEAARSANPQGWEVTNSIKTYINLYENKYQLESLYIKTERVDIGGDVRPALGSDYYYEFGLGLLVKVNSFPSFIENVGIGLNMNVGSDLAGGSLVFYFNES